jgi:hypothetical protein
MKKILSIILLVLMVTLSGCEEEKENCTEEDIKDVQQLMYCENKSYIEEPVIYKETNYTSISVYAARNYDDDIVYYYKIINYDIYIKQYWLYFSDDEERPSAGTQENSGKTISVDDDLQFGFLVNSTIDYNYVYIGLRVEKFDYVYDEEGEVKSVSGWNITDYLDSFIDTNITIKEYQALQKASEEQHED